MNRTRSNKSLFTPEDQSNIVQKTDLHKFNTTINIEEWNNTRENLRLQFKGTSQEQIMLFGYIDGILYAQLFGKKKIV